MDFVGLSPFESQIFELFGGSCVVCIFTQTPTHWNKLIFRLIVYACVT